MKENKEIEQVGKEIEYNELGDIDDFDIDKNEKCKINPKIQKDSEDEYFLQLEQKMERYSSIADKLFGLDYDEIDKKRESKLRSRWNRYEIIIIILFTVLSILSIYFERPINIVIVRILVVSFLVGFSDKADISGKIAPLQSLIPFSSLIYKYHFYKTKWLYTSIRIILIIFTIVYGHRVGMKDWSILRFFMGWGIILLTFGVGIFLGRFVTEIIKFVQRAIKGEVDRKSVFMRLLLIFIIGVIVRICIEYDIPGLAEKRR